MMYKDEDGKWVLDDKEYESLRTIYGYLLSNYTNNGFTPCRYSLIEIQMDNTPEGGNGKSLVMRSVRHWKKSYEIEVRYRPVIFDSCFLEFS